MSKINSKRLMSAGRNMKNAIFIAIVTSVLCFGILYFTMDYTTFVYYLALLGGVSSLYLWISTANDLINCELPNFDENQIVNMSLKV